MNVTASNKLIDLSLLSRYDGKLKTYVGNLIGTLGNKAENTPYANVKDYVDTQVATINGAAGTLEGRVLANENAITKLNGAATVEGSVAKAVADAIAGVIDGAPEAFDTLKEIATWIGSGEDIQGTTAATMLADITTLKGDANTAGSVAKALKDAKDYADGLSNAIKGNATSDTAASKTIEGLSKRIAAEETARSTADSGLSGRLDTIEGEGAGSIKKAVKDLADGQVKTNKESIDAINNTTTGILAQAKSYADGLAGNYDAAGTAQGIVDGLGGSKEGTSNGVKVTVTTSKGEVSGVTVVAPDFAATYDALGAAAAVQGSTTETVASVDAKVEALALASNDEIDALFA